MQRTPRRPWPGAEGRAERQQEEVHRIMKIKEWPVHQWIRRPRARVKRGRTLHRVGTSGGPWISRMWTAGEMDGVTWCRSSTSTTGSSSSWSLRSAARRRMLRGRWRKLDQPLRDPASGRRVSHHLQQKLPHLFSEQANSERHSASISLIRNTDQRTHRDRTYSSNDSSRASRRNASGSIGLGAS